MPTLPGEHRSLWTTDSLARSHGPLEHDLHVDVAVVGGGIVGVTTALLCREAGLSVAVLEARTIGSGTTEGTTGKITSQHDLFYAEGVRTHGEEAMRTYAEANQAAIALFRDMTERHGIDAYATPAPSYVFTREESQVDAIAAEANTAAELGLPARFVTELDLPFEILAAVEFADQLQVHPGRLVHGLASAIEGEGCTVHEHSRVIDITEQGGRAVVRTSSATVTADHVVVATLLPILDRGLEFARTRPSRSYGIAVTVDGSVPTPMYISAESPKRSLRHYHGELGTYLVVVGDGHDTGEGTDLSAHWQSLIDFAQAHFPVTSVAYRWSAQDFYPADGIPYVGRLRFSDHVQIATGFRKWGLSNGMVAAQIMRDTIVGKDNPWADVFSARPLESPAGIVETVKDNIEVAKHFVGDRVGLSGRDAVDDLAPGQGVVIRHEGRPLAVCRDADGGVSAVSGICSHLGCLVAWNDAEASWDCPCHGSRFSPHGSVLTGPTRKPLERVDLE